MVTLALGNFAGSGRSRSRLSRVTNGGDGCWLKRGRNGGRVGHFVRGTGPRRRWLLCRVVLVRVLRGICGRGRLETGENSKTVHHNIQSC